MPRENQLILEDAKLLYRNFTGKEGPYNREGDRNYCVFLDPQLAEQMGRDGWNIKFTKPREEGDEALPYLQVSVNFKGRPPQIFMLNPVTKSRDLLEERDLPQLDSADIVKTDMIINPYHYNVNGKQGISAYCEALYVTIDPDPLALKYADYHSSNQTPEF